MSNLFKFAENILNNLDHSTQSSINGSGLSKTSSGSSLGGERKNSTPTLNDTLMHAIKHTTKSKSGSKGKLKTKDDELMDYLNNGTGIDVDNQQNTDLSNLKAPFNDIINSATNKSDVESDMDADDLKRNRKIEFEIGGNSENSDATTGLLNPKEEKLLINENKRLKSEMNSLQSEIRQLTGRVKNAEDEYQRSKRKIDHYQNQISEGDKIIRELRAREDDTNEAIKSKDTQLAILRVRLNEVDTELRDKRNELENLKNESDRILKDHSSISDVQSQAFETLKEKLSQLEMNLQRERDGFANAQKEHLSKQNRLEQEKHELVTNLNLIEKKINDEKSRVNDLTNQLKIQKQANASIKQELEDYKLKAAKILQSKDKLISSLKEGLSGAAASGDNNADAASSSTSATSLSSDYKMNLIEIEELRSERDFLKEELFSKNSQIDSLKTELQDLDSQTGSEIESLKDQIHIVQDNLLEERQKRDTSEMDIRNLRQELQYAQEELYKHKTNLNTRLQERDKEIEKLRNQLTAKSVGTTTEKELENRLHSLTESIIQKQTMIEALQSEKHSYYLQLERSEKRLQDYENIVSSRKPTVLNLNEDDENVSRHAPYFRESPHDHEVTKKVKRAASEIDKFSIRLGVFLKRYPIARVFVIIYMIILHLWVLIVLFTYKPEIHDMISEHALPKLPSDEIPH